MSKVEVVDLARKLVDRSGKQLKDSSVPTEVLSYAKAADASVHGGSIKAIFGASVGAAIHLYNSADDIDDDGIISAPPPDAQPQESTPGVDFRPQIHFDAGSTWLKYSLAADATAKATGKIGMAGGSIGGDRSVLLLCYKRHNTTDRIGQAVAADLDGVASPLTVSDILGLGVQEATALKIRGKLTATLTLTWADIFSTSLHQLGGLLGSRSSGALMLSIPASASVTFAATLDDDFTLCFTRESMSGDRAIRVALRKSVTHDHRFAAKAGVQIGFADPAAVETVLTKVMAGVLDVQEAALAAIERAPSLQKVPEQYQPVVTVLAERYGIEDLDPLAPLKAKLKNIRSSLTDRIDQMAKAKVSTGFQYEYVRIASEASLLEATLSEAALGKLHGALLAFDFAKVLAYQGPGLALDFFLHQKTVDRVRAWGFSLGIGTWLSLQSRQKRRDLFVSRRYRSPGEERVTRAYLGSTHYKANINSWSTEYGAVLKADLEEARTPEQSAGRDFNCGLHLWWQESRIKPASELARVVDDAVLWGVIGAEAAPELHAQLHRAIGQMRECTPRLSAQLSDHGLRHAVRVIASAVDGDWGRHAARALPWYAKQTARATCASRETVYTPFFADYARARDRSGSALKGLIASSLRDYGGGLAGQEARGETAWTLYQVLLRSNIEEQRFWRRWNELQQGASRLVELLDIRGNWGDFRKGFGLMSGTFEQAFLMRAVASLLAQQLPEAVHDGAAFTTTLTITYVEAGKEQAIVVGGKA